MEQVINSSVPEATILAKSTNLPDNLSPQCIGREFVRCYYTLLHDNPNKLHRFYLDQSTFVHGNQTEETAECVSGQRAIHEKIMSLNFVDCRTKIKHVDSQPTIDNGVVVQVSGELSNAGKLPRRFMQTFVLGSQTPRKYYVHNDIFRYQDEVFGYDQDEIADDDENSVSSQEDINEQLDEEPHQKFQDTFKSEPVEEKTNGKIVEPETNNNVNHEVIEDLDHSDFQPVEEIQPEPQEDVIESEPVDEEQPVEDFSTASVEEVVPEIAEEVVEEQIVEPEPEPVPEVPKGPKSWAMIAGSGSAPAPAARIVVQQPSTPPKPAPEPKEVPKKETAFQSFKEDRERSEGRGGRRKPDPQRERGFGGERGSYNKDRFQEREAPNANQIFVGNLPNNTAYGDLEEKFKSYGTVVHVRVTPNNFGFVVFENEGPVQAILRESKGGKKFFINDQMLNVEEKKTATNSNRGQRKPFNDQRGGSRRGRRGGTVGRYNNDPNSDLK